MGEWLIYGSNGSQKATVKKLEYSGEFMGETSVTCDVYSPSPISFSIGDYLVYRGERFTIDYDATRLKQARNNTYGKGYTYENMRFLSYVGELKKCEFLDFVPSDNLIHFSQLPDFSFYAETVNDLADRIQANLDRIYTGGKAWTVQVVQGFEGKENINVSVSKSTCFDALRMAYEQFEATFIIRGRTITIGTAGNELETDFRYGKGNGLKTIERSVDESDAIVTRLRAYGNTTNMPANYYKNIGMQVYAPIYEIYHVSSTGCDIHFVPKLKNACFNDRNGQYQYWITVSLDKSLWLKAVVSPNTHLSSTNYSVVTVGLYDGNTQAMVTQFNTQLQSGTYSKLYFKNGINVGAWPVQYREYAENVPDLMAIDRLMLPGFPELTTDPYIDSSNIATLGVREKSVYFDGSDPDTPDIHPTLEGMTAAELRAAGYVIDLDSGDNGNLDEIAADATETDGSPITADGAFEGVDEVPGFKVTIKDIGFDINDYLSTETATLVMKTGMCGGMEFTIVKVDKVGNKYVLECQRTEDVAHYFPYNPYLIKAGDKFVLTNLEMPKAYIDAASQRLLTAAQEYIAKYSEPQWVYAIKMDDVWMQRQRDNSVSEASSYYWNIKEGDVMNVIDTDLGVDIAEVIDRLSIREGFGPIPEFEVVLRKEKPQGTIGVLQNRIRQLELRNAEQVSTIYRQQNYIDLIIGDKLNTIQEQLDHVQVTYFGDYVPTLSNEPASTWASSEYSEHDGDMFYNRTTGKGYEFTYKNGSWGWVEIQDEDIRQALEDAAAAQDTADGKRRVFVTPAGTLPTPPYDENDLWVNATYPSDSTLTDESQHKYYNDILKCITPRAEGATASINDWSLGSKYTDDSSLNAFLNGYTGTLTGIRTDITNAATAASNAQTSANNANTAAAAAQATADALDYLKQAYLADNTLIDHGLILSTIVALRDSSNNVWSGISGAYDSTKLGNGIAAWYGGGMIDKEVSAVSNAAKSLFRFDGSGYVASGNLKWDANGNVTIQGYSINATTLQVGGSNVATESSISTFFANFFDIYNGSTQITYEQYVALQDKSNVSLKAKYGLWTEQFLSALGLNSQGGGGGGTGSVNSIKIASNTYLDPDSDGIIDMSSYAANWNDAYNKRHTHSNKSVLDEITSTKVSNWDAVYGVVPSAAYESGNQLADKNFVNSSISTATATYISNNGVPFNSLAELQAYTGQHDKNDYAFVKTTDSAGNTLYNRYKFDGTSWSLEYTLNNSSFTADQWSAINSGITSSLVSKLNGIAAGAQVNVLESVKINGTALSISSKAVNIVTGNGLQSSSNTISILLPSNSGLSVSSTGLKLDIVNNLTTESAYRAISATQAKKIWDLLNQMFTLEGAGTTASPYVIKANYGLYTEQFLSALGQNSSGGSGGDFDEAQMWAALQANTGTYANTKINIGHIPDLSGTYATKTWVNQQGFVTSSGVTSVATGTGLTGGTITSTGTISINSTYQTYISNGNTAYGWGNHATAGYASASSVTTLQGYFTNGVAKTAAKLSTVSKTAWGQTYWTSGGVPQDVDGSLTINSGQLTIWDTQPTAETRRDMKFGWVTDAFLMWAYEGSYHDICIGAVINDISGKKPLYYDQSANSWGIGTATPAYTLDVQGNIGAYGHIYLSRNNYNIVVTDNTGNTYSALGINGSNSLLLGYGTSGAGYNTNIYGNNIYFRYGTSRTLGFTLDDAGKVIIPSTGKLKIGDCTIEWDSTNAMLKFDKGIYSTGAVSALGANSSGGGGGTFDEEAMWVALGTTVSAKVIASSHIPNLSASKITSGTLAAARIPNLSWTKITSDKPTTLSGYGVLDDADGRYYALYGGTNLNPSSSNTVDLDNLTSAGSYYCSGNTAANYVTNKPVGNLAFRIWVSAPNGTSLTYVRQRFQAYNQVAIYERVSTSDSGISWGNWYTVQANLSNYALTSSLDNYLPLSGGTITGSLTVNSTITTLDSIYMSNAKAIYFKDSGGTSRFAIALNSSDSFMLGYGIASEGYNTYLDGNGVFIRYGTSRTTGILLNSSGNVGIGTTSPSYKLSVNGDVSATNFRGALIGNADTSTTLETSRTIWGQSFNGSANVSGNMTGVGSITANGDYVSTRTNNTATNVTVANSVGSVGIRAAATNRGLVDVTNDAWIVGTNGTNTWLSQGNVGIGTTSPAYKLDVSGTFNTTGATTLGSTLSVTGAATLSSTLSVTGASTLTGNITAGGDIYLSNAKYIRANNSSGTAEQLMGMNGSNQLLIGYGHRTSGSTILYGLSVTLSTNGTSRLYVLSSGNVGIANSSPSEKLHVTGNILASGEVTASSDERKKNIISNTKFSVKDIASARSIIYEWNDDRDKDNEKKIHGGSIAQDWLGKADSFLSQDNDGWYSINYGALALCSAITIARMTINHEDRITLLEKENARLKARVAELEERRMA